MAPANINPNIVFFILVLYEKIQNTDYKYIWDDYKRSIKKDHTIEMWCGTFNSCKFLVA